MKQKETGSSCWVCGGKVIKRTTECLADGDIMSMEVGNERMTIKKTIFCGTCHLLYESPPPPKPITTIVDSQMY